MSIIRHIKSLLLIFLLSFAFNSSVSAKPTSGVQNIVATPHQGQTIFNSLMHQGKTDVSTIDMSGSTLGPKGGLLKTGIKHFDDLGDISNFSAKDLVSYAKLIESKFIKGEFSALTRNQAAAIVKRARELGIKVRIDQGHSGTKWNMPHINIGPKTRYHIPILPKK